MFHLRDEEDEDGYILGFLHIILVVYLQLTSEVIFHKCLVGKNPNPHSYIIKVHEYNIIVVIHGQQYESLWLTLLYSTVYNIIFLVILCPEQKKN